MFRILLAATILAAVALGFGGLSAAAPSDAGGALQGDVNCDSNANSVDALGILQFTAHISTPACIASGNVNCDAATNSVDALGLLLHTAKLPGLAKPAGCVDIGDPLPGPGGLIPDEAGGEPLVVTAATGAQLVAADDGWAQYFTSLGVDPAAVTAEVAAPPFGSQLDLRITAIRAEGTSWAARMVQFSDAAQASAGGYTVENLTLAGQSVFKVTATNDASIPPSYYYPSGEILYIIVSTDEALVAGVVAGLPEPTGKSLPAALPLGEEAPYPGSGPLIVTLFQQLLPPICVAEPYGRHLMSFMALDLIYRIPLPAIYTVTTIIYGEVLPIVSAGGIGLFNYRARTLGGTEQMQVLAVAPAGGSGPGFTSFNNQHCLNGTWQDGGRVLTINHFGSSITANITSGTLSCGEGGVAFTGSLSPGSSNFSGSDLKICNPEECVEAGFLEKVALADYSATVSPDGQSIDFQWTNQYYDIEYDDNDNIISCTESYTQTDSFSNSRLTFGPGTP